MASYKEFRTGIDLRGNDLKNTQLERVSAAGSIPSLINKAAGIYYKDHSTNTALSQIRIVKAVDTQFALINVSTGDTYFENDSARLFKHTGFGTAGIYVPTQKGAVALSDTGNITSLKMYGISGENTDYFTEGSSPYDTNSLMSAKKIKTLIDALTGFQPIPACVVAHSDGSALPNPSGATVTIDGVEISDGDRILVIDSTNSYGFETHIVTWDATGDVYVSQLDPEGGEFVFVINGTVNGGKSFAFDGTEWVQVGASSAYTAGTGIELIGTEFSLILPSELPSDTTPLENNDAFYFDDYNGGGTRSLKHITYATLRGDLNIPTLDATNWSILYTNATNEIKGLEQTVNNRILLLRDGAAPVESPYTMPSTAQANAIPYFSSTSVLTRDSSKLYYDSTDFKLKGHLGIISPSSTSIVKIKNSNANGNNWNIILPTITELPSNDDILYVVNALSDDIQLGYTSVNSLIDVYYTFNGLNLDNQGELNIVGASNQITVDEASAMENAVIQITLSLPETIYAGVVGTTTIVNFGVNTSNKITIDKTIESEKIVLTSNAKTFSFSNSAGAGLIEHNYTNSATIGTSSKRFHIYADEIYVDEANYLIPYVLGSKFVYLAQPSVAGQQHVLVGQQGTAPIWLSIEEISPTNNAVYYESTISGDNSSGSITLSTAGIEDNSYVIAKMYDPTGNQIEIEEDMTSTTFAWSTNGNLGLSTDEFTLVLIGKKRA